MQKVSDLAWDIDNIVLEFKSAADFPSLLLLKQTIYYYLFIYFGRTKKYSSTASM